MFVLLRLILLIGFTWNSVTTACAADEFLDPAIAFKPTVRALDAKTLEVSFEIAKGYYLYRDKFRFSAEGSTLGAPTLPKGKEKNDENFGKVEVYYRSVAITVPVERISSGPQSLALKVTSQGCADAGICYPPQSQLLAITLPADSPEASAATPLAEPAASSDGDESGRIATHLKKSGFWTILVFFFAAGIAIALTPCVYPMIPILAGIIAGQGQHATRSRSLALTLAYILGMAIAYGVLGVIVGLTGDLVSNSFQNIWVLGSFSLLFVILALSMFGFYEIQLPSALQSKLSEEAGHLQGGRGPAVILMGALSVLIVGPCVAVPLAGGLLYIAQTADPILGGASLFVLGIGKGIPLLLVGLSAGTLLPKAGAWMEAVKKAFGFVFLGVSLSLISPMLPSEAVIAGRGILLIMAAIFLRAIDPLPTNAHGWQRFWKGIGIVLLITGAALLVGALSGARDPLRPLAGLASGAQKAPEHLPFERVATIAALDARLAKANKPVMLDFYADWCVSCKEMERDTFSDPTIRAQLAGFTLLQIDVTANTEADALLLKRFGLFGPPGIIFFDQNGKEIAGQRVVGYQDAATFGKTLKRL